MAFSIRNQSHDLIRKSKAELIEIQNEQESIRGFEGDNLRDIHEIKLQQDMTEETLMHLLNSLNAAMSLKAERMFKVNGVSEEIGKCLLEIEALPEKFGKYNLV